MRSRSFLAVFVGSLALALLGAQNARADAIGQSQAFGVDASYDAAGATSISATARAVGQHAYFYVDDRYWGNLSPLQQQQYTTLLAGLSNAFDTVIYPRSTAFWGSENTPGVDNDPHVFVLLEQLSTGSGGYFQTINSYAKSLAPESNAHEMIYVDAGSVLGGLAKDFVAHELQHLISFYQKDTLRQVHEDVWLNEGRSEYNVTVVGYDDPFSGSVLQSRMLTFLQHPSDSLVEWPNTDADYGIASMFMHYLADAYGPATVAATIHTATAGVAAIADALSTQTAEQPDDVFVDWMLASFMNDRTVDPRYGYASAGLRSMHVAPLARVQLDALHDRFDFSTLLKEWQPLWIEADIASGGITPAQATVRVAGAGDAIWRGAVLALYRDGSRTITRIPATSTTPEEVSIPTSLNGAALQTLVPMITQDSDQPSDGRTILAGSVVVTVALGTPASVPVTPAPTPAPYVPADGDLIRRIGQPETYVIWGTYRRYLSPEVLKLYGFQDRTVHEVADERFFAYAASNYIRAQGQQKVYAVWPDNTKHWLDITPAQWDASGRDWNAIFTVNDAEVAYYQTGQNIVH